MPSLSDMSDALKSCLAYNRGNISTKIQYETNDALLDSIFHNYTSFVKAIPQNDV